MDTIKLTYPNLLEKEGITLEMLGAKAQRKAKEIQNVYAFAQKRGVELTENNKNKMNDLDEDICQILASYLVEKEDETPEPTPAPPAPVPAPAPVPEPKKKGLRIFGMFSSEDDE